MAVNTGRAHHTRAAVAMAIAAVLLASVALTGNALASSSSSIVGANSFCNRILPTSTPFGISSIVDITMVVLFAMVSVIGLAAAIGYALDVPLLKRFMRNEAGEIAITVIIAIAFLGTLAADGSLNTGYASTLSGINYNLFYEDCNAMSVTALYTSMPALVSIGSFQDILTFISSIKIQYAPNGFGFEVIPYQGISAVQMPVINMFTIAGALVGIMIAVPVILGIIYGLFPLFFYTGLVLRALPWTRAAGGAFLGMFLGLYIVFPLLLHAMMCAGSSICTTAPVTVGTCIAVGGILGNYATGVTLSSLLNLGSFFVNFADTAINNLSGGIISGTLEGVVAPVAFMLFDVFISFIVSLDFAEIMGGYLGAQSLSGGGAFKKLI